MQEKTITIGIFERFLVSIANIKTNKSTRATSEIKGFGGHIRVISK